MGHSEKFITVYCLIVLYCFVKSNILDYEYILYIWQLTISLLLLCLLNDVDFG